MMQTLFTRNIHLGRVALFFFAATLALAYPLSAQESGATFVFDQSSQPLKDSIKEFSETTGIDVVSRGSWLRGKDAPSLRGEYTAGQALGVLLEGSELKFEYTSSNTIAITSPLASSDLSFARGNDANGDEVLDLDKVTLVGTKIEQSLQDLEASVEVFTIKRLEREQITVLSELLLKAPNVSSVGGADQDFTIRGIGRRGVTFGGQGVTSNVYVDGSPITTLNLNRGPVGLWDAEQVEVLRGPQSSVQGRNALAGSIVINTADPTFEPEGKLRVTYAESDTYQVAGAFSGPIIEGLLAGRIAVSSESSDGFLTNSVLGGADYNESENLTFRGKLLLSPENQPNFYAKLTLDVNESEDFGEDSIRVIAPDDLDDPGFSDFDPRARVSARNQILGNDNEGFRVVSETGLDFTEDLTGRLFITYEDYSTLRTFGDENDVLRFDGYTANQFDETNYSVEPRLEFESANIKGLVGAYFFHQDRQNDNNTSTNLQSAARDAAGPLRDLVSVTPPETLLVARNVGKFDTENYALFGQFDWQIGSRWTLGVGARYDVEDFMEKERISTTGVDNPNSVITLPAAILGLPSFDPIMLPSSQAVTLFFGATDQPLTSADFEAFLPRVSLTYEIDENSSVFLSLARGYRAGGAFTAIEQNPGGTGFTQFIGQYDPEYLDTIEIGTRNVLLEGRMTLNANIFYSKYKDQQVSVDGFDPSRADDNLVVNAGESTLYGAEFIVDYDLNEAFDAYLSVGLLETEFDDFPFAEDASGNPLNPGDPSFSNIAGDEFRGAPNLTATLGINWVSENGLFGDASLSYTGRTESTVPNISNEDLRQALTNIGADPNLAGNYTPTGETRTDLTGRFGWSNERYQLYVFGSNLLDEDSYTSRTFATVSSLTGQLSLTDPSFTVQRPRLLGVGMDVNF
ncbi:MAG: TonB-dependent receptor [Verrucomicrobiota bacterium]